VSSKEEKPNASSDPMSGLEGKLARTLRPIRPPRAYVRSLRDRIHFTGRPVIIQHATDYNFWLVFAGGVVTALVVVITAARALYYLFGRSRG